MSLAVLRNVEGPIGSKCRVFVYRRLCKSVGSNVFIGPAVFIQDAENLSIGNNVSINEFNLIVCHGGVRIGNDVSIAHNCSILSTSHIYTSADVAIRSSGVIHGEVTLEDNVWVGCGVRILCSSDVGTGVVVGANSVVRGRLEPETIYAGAPARPIKRRIKQEGNESPDRHMT